MLLGLIAMMAISSPQYVWTLFTTPLNAALGASLAELQVTFSLLIVLQTFFSPFQAYLVDRFGPKWVVIAGGILLFLIAIDMLFARPTGAKQTEEETRAASEAENPAVFPLAIPMIAGPGTIATVLLLTGLTHGEPLRM